MFRGRVGSTVSLRGRSVVIGVPGGGDAGLTTLRGGASPGGNNGALGRDHAERG